jgi:flagellar biosynthesis protein FlhF
MIIKKFQAKNEAEALALAKKELGPEVTVMHSRNVKPRGLFSFLKKTQVEITVAKEEEMDRPEVQAKSAIAEVNRARKKAEEKGTKPRQVDLTADDDTELHNAFPAEKAEKAVEEKLDNIQSLLEQKLSKRAEEESERPGQNRKLPVSGFAYILLGEKIYILVESLWCVIDALGRALR